MIVYEAKEIQPEYPKKRTCRKCKSVLGIEKNDIQTFHFKKPFLPITGYKCPVCGEIQNLGIFEY